MRVPFDWLKEFVDINKSPEEVADILTMAGLEVEAVEKLDGDFIFEVNVTPNRPDCLSIIGIAREIATAMNLPLKQHKYEVKEEASDNGFKVEILAPDLCHRYAGRVIKGVKIAPSPDWLKNKITKCGIRTINNIVDITNYVLMESGHPLHAFDLNKMKGKSIKVAPAEDDCSIVTLDGVERKLPPDALLIWDAKNPVAIAGLMGGAETEVSDFTHDVFLESAYFEPASVRRTSRALGLKSESSCRFERGTDIEALSNALDKAAYLIQQVAGGIVYKKVDAYPKRYVPVTVNVRYDRVNKVLGTDIPDEEMADIIKRLGIAVDLHKDYFTVPPPAFRPDIKIEADIIEEIARVYGYQKIRATIPKAGISGGNPDRGHAYALRVKNIVKKAGFSEAINYSFMAETDLDILHITAEDRRRKAVSIKNPLKKESSLLRTTLIPSLLENFIYNFSRGIRDIRIFELSRVFEDIGRPLPLEIMCLGGIYYKDKKPSLWKEEARGFYIVKGMIEDLFGDMHINGYAFSPSNEPFLHPGQSCEIRISGSSIGLLGVVSPVVVDKLDMKVPKPEIVVFEIDLDRLISLIPASMEYSPAPKFPCIERDIAIIVDDKLSASDIENLIRAYPSELIEDVSIFDFYKGRNIPDEKKSLAFTVRYRSDSRTLTEAEVEEMHLNIVKYITAETGGKLRV
ncbi:MAG: phenylalanine--tRNA ligase subunit beta [Thermodesulfovibrionales bacterium]|nr:phenylalanine--tRNA ligase subunit beta [Thermodesulfovibrionales bacterium]